MIRRFKKLPVEIEAIQWNGKNYKEIEKFVQDDICHVNGDIFCIYTLEGTMQASIGDWIIKGVNGEFRELFKDPKTDDGIKKSAKGLIRIEREGNDFILHDQQTFEQEARGELSTVFKDGLIYNYEAFWTIRKRLHPEWNI